LELLGDLSNLTSDLEAAKRYYEEAREIAGSPAEKRRIANKCQRPGFAARAGGKLAYFEFGEGPETLVFMTPIGYNAATFQPVAERLCQEFRIVTMYPRGFGTSDRLPAGYPTRERVADIGTVIDAVGQGPVVGIATSLSVKFLVRLAAERPALFRKIVLIGGSPDAGGANSPWPPPPRPADFQSALAVRDIEQVVRIFATLLFPESGAEDLIQNWVKAALKFTPEALFDFFFDDPDADRDISGLLPGIQVPTLVTTGDLDRLVSMETTHYLRRQIPGAQLYIFAGKGHLPVYTATQEFCDVLRSFVRDGKVPMVREAA
jgi:pimeloyl-ACP methyl ester carboxylesterase